MVHCCATSLDHIENDPWVEVMESHGKVMDNFRGKVWEVGNPVDSCFHMTRVTLHVTISDLVTVNSNSD